MLCRATNALISVRLIYNNLRKKYRNFCFLFCSFVCFRFVPSLNPSFHQPFDIFPQHHLPWVYTTKEYRQNMLRWKRHNRSAYTNNSTVEVKVIGGLFIFLLFTFAGYAISWEIARRCAAFAPFMAALLYFFSKFSFLEILHPRISICYQLFL